MKTPEQFEKECRNIVQALGYLAHEYRWAYGMSHGRQSSADPMDDKVHVSDHGDTTGNTALDHWSLRGELEDASNNLHKTKKGVQDDLHSLRQKIYRDEKPHGILFDKLRNPRSVTRVDLSGFRSAQERRVARGEHVP